MKVDVILPVFVLLGCGSSAKQTPDDRIFRQGDTHLAPGEIRAEDPRLHRMNVRRVDGINVDGPESDIDDTWWNNKLASVGADDTFTEFKIQYKSLDINDSMHQGAQAAALKDFRRWCRQHQILQQFDDWWASP